MSGVIQSLLILRLLIKSIYYKFGVICFFESLKRKSIFSILNISKMIPYQSSTAGGIRFSCFLVIDFFTHHQKSLQRLCIPPLFQEQNTESSHPGLYEFTILSTMFCGYRFRFVLFMTVCQSSPVSCSHNK